MDSPVREKIRQDAQLLLDIKFSMPEDLTEVGFFNLSLIVCLNSEILQESNCVNSFVIEIIEDTPLLLNNKLSMLEDLDEVEFLIVFLLFVLKSEFFAGEQLC